MSIEKKNTKNDIETAFDKIKSSKLFSKSSLHKSILRYLIDQAMLGIDVKEQNIGTDILDENYEDTTSNSKVRVYVYNLRKKLSDYYKEDGKTEEIIFHIEKGQYNISFKRRTISTKKKANHLTLRIPLKPVGLILGICLLALGVFYFQKSNETNYLWEPFHTKNKATLCIVADHFMVSDKEQGCASTYQEIYDMASLDNFNKQNPPKILKKTWFTMTSKMASYGVHYLDLWFAKFNQTFDIQFESETQFSDYSKGNILYIGQSKTMTTSKSIFLQNSEVFKMEMDGFTHQSKSGLKKYKSTIKKIAYEEYTMVSFQKLENGNATLFFVSNHDIGVLATLKIFTSEESLKDFYKKAPSSNSEFNALFKVTGLDRNEMNCELVALEITKP
jgi:hypothetical protein